MVWRCAYNHGSSGKFLLLNELELHLLYLYNPRHIKVLKTKILLYQSQPQLTNILFLTRYELHTLTISTLTNIHSLGEKWHLRTPPETLSWGASHLATRDIDQFSIITSFVNMSTIFSEAWTFSSNISLEEINSLILWNLISICLVLI